MTETAETAPTTEDSDKPGLGGYVVLKRDGSGLWERLAHIAARNGEAAIRAHASEGGLEGVFVAIPARSFTPVKVTAHVETTLTLEDVKAQ